VLRRASGNPAQTARKPHQKRFDYLRTAKTAQFDAKEYSTLGSSGHLGLLILQQIPTKRL
jgi:hypothetical protein